MTKTLAGSVHIKSPSCPPLQRGKLLLLKAKHPPFLKEGWGRIYATFSLLKGLYQQIEPPFGEAFCIKRQSIGSRA